MKKIQTILTRLTLICIICFGSQRLLAQFSPQSITTSFVLQQNRDALNRQLKESTIKKNLSLSLSKDNEFRFESSFWAITQFMVYDSVVAAGFKKTFASYDSLDRETRRSFLEALYTLRPAAFKKDIASLLLREKDPKIFSIISLYLWRENPSASTLAIIQDLLKKNFTEYHSNEILRLLADYLNMSRKRRATGTPGFMDLFRYQEGTGVKRVYSFQRWNRDFLGRAVVQLEDGSFARDENGKLIIIPQLARAASNLPYFITNGNTPQGIYRIVGIDRAANKFIGPTPNLQMIMPNELSWLKFLPPGSDSASTEEAYLELLPESWRGYPPVMEAFHAGAVGRTEIIAHGTTIDPGYFEGKPFYPVSPTLGCLCAGESWNTGTGGLMESDQLRLVNAFLQTPEETGYLIVINIDNQERPVSYEEIEKLIIKYETGRNNK